MSRGVLTGRQFFPELISGPFHQGLVIVFLVGAVLSVLAAFASLLRGGRAVETRGAVHTIGTIPHPRSPRCQQGQ